MPAHTLPIQRTSNGNGGAPPPMSPATQALSAIDLRKPLADVQRDIDLMTDELNARERELAEATKLNNAMAADVDAKNREIERLERRAEAAEERTRMLQSFSVALVTRLDAIGELITTAKREAWEQAKALGIAPKGATEEGGDDGTRLPLNTMPS